jgi:TetR/AcrR family transcriptional regulator, cholesterol catabolism regulator
VGIENGKYDAVGTKNAVATTNDCYNPRYVTGGIKLRMETLVTKKVSIVLFTFMTSEANTKVRIREKAKELFLKYGIRSVSMDDIANQLGMSKKTIYQYFTDKNELVDAVVEEDILEMQNDCLKSSEKAHDAIEEIFIMVDAVVDQLGNLNPMILYDMEKFHIRAFQRFMEHKNKFLLQIIRHNLEWGIKDGLYRDNIDVEILARFRLESMMIPFNIDLYPPAHYKLTDVTKSIIEHFVYGVASQKGYKLILKYQQLRNKNAKNYETETGKHK